VRTVARSPRTLWRRSGERVVLRNRDGGELHVLEGTGVLVWLCLAAPTPVTELVSGFARQFEVGEAEVADDLGAFVEELAGRGVLVVDQR
jgi:hypothetical protein